MRDAFLCRRLRVRLWHFYLFRTWLSMLWWMLRCWITAWSCFPFRFKHLTFNRNPLCLLAHRCLFRSGRCWWPSLFFLWVRESSLSLGSGCEINLMLGLIWIKMVHTMSVSHIISLKLAAGWAVCWLQKCYCHLVYYLQRQKLFWAGAKT